MPKLLWIIIENPPKVCIERCDNSWRGSNYVWVQFICCSRWPITRLQQQSDHHISCTAIASPAAARRHTSHRWVLCTRRTHESKQFAHRFHTVECGTSVMFSCQICVSSFANTWRFLRVSIGRHITGCRLGRLALLQQARHAGRGGKLTLKTRAREPVDGTVKGERNSPNNAHVCKVCGENVLCMPLAG